MKVMTMRMNNSMSNRLQKRHKRNNKIPERGDIFSDSLYTYKCTWVYVKKGIKKENKRVKIAEQQRKMKKKMSTTMERESMSGPSNTINRWVKMVACQGSSMGCKDKEEVSLHCPGPRIIICNLAAIREGTNG
jgi:hypothetical protein